MNETSPFQSAFLKKHRAAPSSGTVLTDSRMYSLSGALGDQHPSVLDRLLHLQLSFRNP